MTKCISCEEPTSGRSKYCREHAKLARAAWREMIASRASDRQEKVQSFEALASAAHAAGMAAGIAAQPVPMGVGQPMPDGSVRLIDVVPDGPCGFAWITIRPGNSSFAIWAKKRRLASPAYKGGVSIWVSQFGQSLERKSAYADAYAAVLQGAGIKAYSGSRMD
jgi:hypothetical protein